MGAPRLAGAACSAHVSCDLPTAEVNGCAAACRAVQGSPTGLLVYEDTTRLIDPKARDHVGWRACEVEAVHSVVQEAIPDEKEN